MHTKQTLAIRALVLALSLTAGAAMAQTTPPDAAAPQSQSGFTSAQFRAALTEAGYTNIHDVEFKGGLWKADVTDATGKDIDVRLDPATGRLYPDNVRDTRLGEADIRAKLTAAGYTRIEDVEFDDGLWEAEATTAQGQRVDLKLDPQDGRVISQTRD
ncbi:PepSY domain-containing protein [Luteimonas sp. XNQY3]|nr:PepSY domain-containing protein [Luteimonas sp. XNQY3]MCD9006193.1 PepSY domain-containing protein [Luteimonas sp. XNQY3]